MAHGSRDRENGAFHLLNCNSPQEQITIMNLTDAGLLTSTDYSCHLSHGLNLLSSSGTPLGLVFQGFIYSKPVLLPSQKLATLAMVGKAGGSYAKRMRKGAGPM